MPNHPNNLILGLTPLEVTPFEGMDGFGVVCYNPGDMSLSGEQAYSVLIVDDEEMNVLLAKTIFEKWGMKTDVAQNGKAALEKIQNNSFDVVLLDVQMPVMSGPEAARQRRAREFGG